MLRCSFGRRQFELNPSVAGQKWCLVSCGSSVERLALSKSIDTPTTVNTGLIGVFQLYTVSTAPVAIVRGATCQGLRASCSFMRNHHQASIFLHCVACLGRNLPEMTIGLNERYYVVT